jgi:hypothetical protein
MRMRGEISQDRSRNLVARVRSRAFPRFVHGQRPSGRECGLKFANAVPISSARLSACVHTKIRRRMPAIRRLAGRPRPAK